MNRSLLPAFFLPFLVLWAGISAAQTAMPFTFRSLTAAQGLSENSVYCLAQDQRGFLWLGTQDGLNRYDGSTFKVFRNDPQQIGSLSSNFILALAVDARGGLWIGTGGGGLNRYDPITGKFRAFKHQEGQPGTLTDDFVRTVFCDRSGSIWAGTEGGLHRYNPKTGRFQLFTHSGSASTNPRINSIRAIGQDARGRLWVGTGAGQVCHLDLQKQELVAHPEWSSASSITALHPDRAGMLWIGTEANGLRRVSLTGNQPMTTWRFEPGNSRSLRSNEVRALIEDPQERLWVGTTEGLHLLNRTTNDFTVYQQRPGNNYSLPNNTVQALFQDRNGLLWVGTDAGVSSFAPRPNAFVTVPVTAGPEPVWAVAEDAQRRLWAGTETQGVICYNPFTGQRQAYRHNAGQPQSLSEDFVRALCFDAEGRLWIGTQRSGLDCLNPATGSITHFRHQPANPQSLSDNAVRAISRANNGRLWVSTEGGLNLLDPATGHCTIFRHNPRQPATSLGTNYVRLAYQDRQRRLWVGTGGGGLVLLDAATGRCRPYRNIPGNPRSLSSNFVRCILQDRRGTLWIGTEGGGLNRLDDPAKGLFTTFREPQGLPNDVVYGMLEDERGNLWLSTNLGIACFTPATQRFRTFDTRDGLLQDEFNAGSCLRGADGQLYFGGSNGLVSFRPATVPANTIAPPVVLTDFRKFNRPVPLDTSITERRTLRLGPRDNFFSIGFAALNYQLPAKNRFEYRLHGFDEKWVEAGARQEATYTNLDPGTYTFQVRAANNDGVWNQQGAQLKIMVTPPWYQTWWFRVLASWAALAVLFLLYRMRVRQLLALERVRHHIARDLHDDMGSTLSSISILSQLARNHQHENRPDQAAALLDQIGDSSRRMLDSMDDIVWAINPAHDTMEAVTTRMRIFASEVLEARGLDFSFTATPEVQGLRLQMRARREFYLLFKEAINNLAKYARCRHATIHLDHQHHHLLLTVRDDGVGFDLQAPAQGGGNGLANMQARAAALHGKLEIRTAPGQGTELRLSVPLNS